MVLKNIAARGVLDLVPVNIIGYSGPVLNYHQLDERLNQIKILPLNESELDQLLNQYKLSQKRSKLNKALNLKQSVPGLKHIVPLL